MINLITEKERCMLWKDECEDQFLLLKYAEVFKYSDKVLRLHVFNNGKVKELEKMGIVINKIELDEPFTIVDVPIEALSQIINLGRLKIRTSISSNKIKDLEEKLAHRIIPFGARLSKYVN